MVAIQQPIELEGTWEDILRRGGELTGLRVRVTVLPPHPPSSSQSTERTLDQILEPLVERARSVQKDLTPARVKGQSAEFSEAVAADLRRQGLKA